MRHPDPPRRIVYTQAQSGPGGLLPILLCGLSAQQRAVPEGVRRSEAGCGGTRWGVVSHGPVATGLDGGSSYRYIGARQSLLNVEEKAG